MILLNSLLFLFIAEFCLATEVKVNTTSGVVLGQTIDVLDHTLNQFLGIPYAEPPVGELRFAKPNPIKYSQNAIDATKPRNSCYQAASLPNLSEDCLFLNIWSPNTSQAKPVMFFIHGGALLVGSSYQSWYNGRALAIEDIVVVTINYRLGALGFLYGADSTAPGNVGFFDQALALQWVRDNIHLFGGDSDQITIFGESAGSWSVSAHLLSPVSKGLFKRAILQSGALLSNKDKPLKSTGDALLEAKQLAKHFNCTDDKNWLSCLRSVSPKEMVEANTAPYLYPVTPNEFLPLSAQNAFQQNKFNKDIDLIIGLNKNEGSGLSLIVDPTILSPNLNKDHFLRYIEAIHAMYPNLDANKIADFYLNKVDLNDSEAIKWKLFDFFGDLMMNCPIYLFAKQYADHSTTSKVFFYDLTYTLQYPDPFAVQFPPGWFNDTGVTHGVDIAFVFGLPLLTPNWKSKTDIEFSKQLIKMWTDFAKSSKPSDNWLQFKSGNEDRLIKDLNPFQSKEYFIDLFGETCDGFWKSYFLIKT